MDERDTSAFSVLTILTVPKFDIVLLMASIKTPTVQIIGSLPVSQSRPSPHNKLHI